MEEVTGLLVLDKPAGMTSHDVVDAVRRLFGMRKVGHAGTLDPPATGVLLVGLGRATRLLTFLLRLPKEYQAQIAFGVTTSTQDATGETIESKPCRFGADDLRRAAERFRGQILQVPPMVSALKVGGERLYRAARRGEDVQRSAREVNIYSLEIDHFDPAAYLATLRVACSSGTYIRTLAADIGEALGCGAHLRSLVRTAIGSFSQTEALSLERLAGLSESERMESVLPPAEAMRDFPVHRATDEDVRKVASGRPVRFVEPPARAGEIAATHVSGAAGGAHTKGMSAGVPIAVVDSKGDLLAVYRRTRGELKPAVVLKT